MILLLNYYLFITFLIINCINLIKKATEEIIKAISPTILEAVKIRNVLIITIAILHKNN